MRNMQIVDDKLLDQAQKLSGLRQKAAVLNAGLQALIARENARRLIALGGTEPTVKASPRRRSRVNR
jgi:Bacterial antitoxin of type II TA system, VapB